MISGTLLISASNAFRLALQFLLLPVLARILGPDAYGLMALAMPFIMFVNIVSDAGLGGALVREKNPSPALESSVFFASLATGLALAAILAAAAWPLAFAIRRPEAGPVIAALAPVLVLSAMVSAPTARVLRGHRFGVLAIGDVLSTTLSAACAFTAALSGLGVWSLVIQQLVLWAVKLTWLTVASKIRIVPSFRFGDIRHMIAFGLNGMGASLLDMFARSIDSVLIGSLLGVTALGYYSMSFQLVRMPEMLVVGALYTALFPAIAQVSGQPDMVASRFLGALRQMTLICAPLLAGLSLVAGPLVGVVLGAKWAPAAPVLMWLPITGFAFCVTALTTALLFGLGHAHIKLRLSAVSTAATLVGIAAGAGFGIAGVAIGLAAGSLFVLAFAGRAIVRYGGVAPLSIVRALGPIAVATAAMAAAVEGVELLTASQHQIVQLIAGVAVGGLVYAVVMIVVDRRQLLADTAILRSRLRRAPA